MQEPEHTESKGRLAKLVEALQRAQHRLSEVFSSLFQPPAWRDTQLPEGKVHPNNSGENIFQEMERTHQEVKQVAPQKGATGNGFFDEYKDRD